MQERENYLEHYVNIGCHNHFEPKTSFPETLLNELNLMW